MRNENPKMRSATGTNVIGGIARVTSKLVIE